MSFYKIVQVRDKKYYSMMPVIGSFCSLQYKPGKRTRLPKALKAIKQPMFACDSIESAKQIARAYLSYKMNANVQLEIWECEIVEDKSKRRVLTNLESVRLLANNECDISSCTKRKRSAHSPGTVFARMIKLIRKRVGHKKLCETL